MSHVWNITTRAYSCQRHKSGNGYSEGVEIQDDDLIKQDDNENDFEMLDADNSGEKECPILNIFDLLINPTFMEDN